MSEAMTPLEAMMIDAKKCNAAMARAHTKGGGTKRVREPSTKAPAEMCDRVARAHVRGASAADIALMTGLTRRGVNYHLQNLRDKRKPQRKSLEQTNGR